jgi:transposase InsO family protein
MALMPPWASLIIHLTPRTPKMNAHCERFNRTLQDELVDDNLYDLEDTDE